MLVSQLEECGRRVWLAMDDSLSGGLGLLYLHRVSHRCLGLTHLRGSLLPPTVRSAKVSIVTIKKSSFYNSCSKELKTSAAKLKINLIVGHDTILKGKVIYWDYKGM